MKKSFNMVVPKIEGQNNESILLTYENIYNLINCLNSFTNVWSYVDEIIGESETDFTVRINVEISEQVA